MIRFTLSLIVSLALVVMAAVWFSDRPGSVAIQWQGYLIELSIGRFVLVAATLIVLMTVAVGAMRALGRTPGRFREGRRASRRERGYRALTHGMVAVAAGDAAEAGRQARRADVLLDEPPLTMLLSAQAAQLNGDEEAAKRYFTAMLDREETAFLGLRGLLIQAQRKGDRPAALHYAIRAYQLQPKTPWVLSTMFDLQVRQGEWRAALTTLDTAVKSKALGAEEVRNRRAAVLLGCSDAAGQSHDAAEALKYAKRASSLAPDYLPATIRTVELLVGNGKEGQAARQIEAAWARTPHPRLAHLYGEVDSATDPLNRVKRFEKLLAANSDHDESHLALARAALDAGLWGEARNHLEKVAENDPPVRVCRLMAELEEREFGDGAATREWLVRAAAAPSDPAWLCRECGTQSDAWSPLCPACGALGTLYWATPTRSRALEMSFNARSPEEGGSGISGAMHSSLVRGPAINAGKEDDLFVVPPDVQPPGSPRA